MTDKDSQKMIELTVAERAGLERIASTEPPYSQRAQGLIAMADGANLAEAGMASGLTINQMRHWLGRFGTRRLSIFPEDLLAVETLKKETKNEPLLLDAPEEEPLLKAPEIAAMLEAPELAGELPEIISDNPALAASLGAAGAAVAAKAKKNKKDKKSKKDKMDKKKNKGKKGKKGKKSKKSKKNKDKKSKKNKKNKKKN